MRNVIKGALRDPFLKAALAIAVAACGSTDTTPPVAVASVRFSAPPISAVAGKTQTISVELLGADGQRAHGASNQVSLSMSDGNTFSGPSSIRASNGLATFNNVVLTHAGHGLFLTAVIGAQTARTDAFDVTPGVVSGTQSTASASVTTLLPTEPAPVSFRFRDAYGNALALARVTVYAATGSTFTPPTGATDSTGAFTSTFRTSLGGSVPVSAVVNDDSVTLATPLAVCTNPGLTFPSTVSSALTSASCVVAGSPTAYYRFTTSAASTGVSFALTSAFSPTIEVRSDPVTSNSIVVEPPQVLSTEWLLPGGAYELRVSSHQGAGSYTLTSATHPGNTGCLKRYLVTPGTFTGQALAAGDCPYEASTFTDEFVFSSPLPCGFRLHTTHFTPWLFLYEHSTGFLLDGRTEDPGTDLVFGKPACTVAGGPIELWVTSDPGEPGGDYTLTITLFPPAGQPVAFDATEMSLAARARDLRRRASQQR